MWLVKVWRSKAWTPEWIVTCARCHVAGGDATEVHALAVVGRDGEGERLLRDAAKRAVGRDVVKLALEVDGVVLKDVHGEDQAAGMVEEVEPQQSVARVPGFAMACVAAQVSHDTRLVVGPDLP